MNISHYIILVILIHSLFITPISSEAMNITSLCLYGCQLLSNPEIPCYSHSAFVPNSLIPTQEILQIDTSYINELIQDITNNNLYYCFDPNYEIINFPQNEGTYEQSGNGGIFDLDSPVLIWQAIIISIIVPLMALLIFKVVLILCNKCCEISQCQEKDKCCCLYLCSAQYRQRRRNRRFHNEIYNNPNNNDLQNDDNRNNKWWKFNRKNNDNLQENENDNDAPIIIGGNNDNDDNKNNGEDGIGLVLENEENGENININNNDYQNLPLNDDGAGNVKNVLEEVSVDHGEMEKYLQAPGGNNQDIELSFSSQGLRAISYRDVV